MRLYSLFLVAVTGGLTLAAAGANAATVTWTLEAAGGSFDLFAEASLDDNFGIASYNVMLDGNFTSLIHKSPSLNFVNGPGGVGPAGFTLFRSANGNPAIGGSQETIAPTLFLVRGMGQTANSFQGLGFGLPLRPQGQFDFWEWDAKLLVASGTYTGARPAFSDDQIEFFTNVFSAATGVATEPAQLNLRVVPEPEALAMAIMMIIGTICFLHRGRLQPHGGPRQ